MICVNITTNHKALSKWFRHHWWQLFLQFLARRGIDGVVPTLLWECIYVSIGQFLPHVSLSVIAVDASSNITRASSRNQVKADHTEERKEGICTKAKEKYQG